MQAPDERTGETFSFQHMRDPVDGCRFSADGVTLEAPKDWRWQRFLTELIHQNPRVIELKSRQLGCTWLGCAYIVWTALAMPASLCLIYRQKEEEAQENIQRCWHLLQSLPMHLRMDTQVIKPDRGALPSGEIRLRSPDGKVSRILAMSSASASGHGKTAAVIMLDEYSRIDKAAEIMKAVNSAAGTTGKIMVISTANGVSDPETGEGNYYHWLWANAEDAGYKQIFLPWNLHPDRDQDWYDTSSEVRGLRSHERAEQYPADPLEAFQLTNRVFFDTEDLDHYRKHRKHLPLYRGYFQTDDKNPAQARLRKRTNGALRVYEEPRADGRYAIGADVATGRGVDYSAAYVVDLETMGFAAEYHARVPADLYAEQLHFLGRWYNTALLAIETQGGYGEAVLIALRDRTAGRPIYPKLYRHVLDARPDMPVSKPYGFPTNQKTRCRGSPRSCSRRCRRSSRTPNTRRPRAPSQAVETTA